MDKVPFLQEQKPYTAFIRAHRYATPASLNATMNMHQEEGSEGIRKVIWNYSQLFAFPYNTIECIKQPRVTKKQNYGASHNSKHKKSLHVNLGKEARGSQTCCPQTYKCKQKPTRRTLALNELVQEAGLPCARAADHQELEEKICNERKNKRETHEFNTGSTSELPLIIPSLRILFEATHHFYSRIFYKAPLLSPM